MMFKITFTFTERLIITCLVCHQYFNVDSLEFMEVHRQICKQTQQNELNQPQSAAVVDDSATTNLQPVQPNNSQISEPPIRKITPKPIQSSSSHRSGAPLRKTTCQVKTIQRATGHKNVEIRPKTTTATAQTQTQNSKPLPVQTKMSILNLDHLLYKNKGILTKEGKQMRIIECQICKALLHVKLALRHRHVYQLLISLNSID